MPTMTGSMISIVVRPKVNQNPSVSSKRMAALKSSVPDAFKGNRENEDMGMAWIDVDGDHDLDLDARFAGSEDPEASSNLMDRLYINNSAGGNINFTLSPQVLPTFKFESHPAYALAISMGTEIWIYSWM